MCMDYDKILEIKFTTQLRYLGKGVKRMDGKLHKIHTIYDLIIYAYERIRGKSENKILSCYREKIPEYRKEINSLLREVMMCNLTIEEFVKEIIPYLEVDFEQVCIHILMEFDHYYGERNQYPLFNESTISPIIDYKIENNISKQLTFYPMGQDNFIMNSKVMSKARTHRLRGGIWDSIFSYRVNEMDPEHCVMIKKYNNNGIKQTLIQKGCLTFAVVPFSNVEPFDRDGKTGILKYKNYNIEEMKKIYENCISLLEELDEMEIDIVIFPEIVMQEELVSKIKKWMTQKAIKGTNLKLLFMGSYYTEDINRCVLLSGTGKLLLSNDKQNGFEYHDNNNDPHREMLGNKSNNINLIDINGLGRVWYLICKDALIFDEVVNIVTKYGCNVKMISSYSESISDFQSVGASLARIYQVFSVVCNSCAVRKENDIGVITYPVFYDKGKNISSWDINYTCTKKCEECTYGKCAHIFWVNVNEGVMMSEEKSVDKQVMNHKLIGVEIKYKQLKK